MNAKLKNILLVALRWLLGGVFLFSGLVKCVDPVGNSIFVDKYLVTYGLGSLGQLSLPIAVALSTIEVVVGILLIIGLFSKRITIATTLILSLFTIITLLSATLLPIGDCGCFGEAVKLSPWQTFAKNILLLSLAIVLLRHTEYKPYVWRRVAVVVVAIIALPIAINIYSLRYLPLVDFMPYKVGVDLRSVVHEERNTDGVLSILIFKNITTGDVVEYLADDMSCWENEALEYVDARTEVVENEAGSFADFILYNRDGEDVTLDVLDMSGRVVWLCVNDVEKLTGRCKGYIELLQSIYPKHAIVVLVASDSAYVAKVLNSEVYTIDAMTLRSIVRADIGVVVVNNGVVEFKSDIRDI